MFHVTFGIYFWFGFFAALIFMIWHVVCGIWYIVWQIDCDGEPQCFGCSGRSPSLPNAVDTLWIANWVFVWVFAIINFAYLWIIGVLRSRTEFGLFWWAATEMKTNGNVGMVPSPLSPFASSPTAPGAAQS